MTIAFVGWASFDALQGRLTFNPPLPKVAWGFPLGAAIVLGLVRRGHHVHVIVTDHQFETHREYAADGCTVHVLPEGTTRRMFFSFFREETSAMAQLIRSVNPDVVFAQWTYQNAMAALKSGRPFLSVAHDSPWRVLWMFRNVQSLIKAVYAQLCVIPRLKHVTAVSPHIVDDLKRLNGYGKEVRVIPNGIAVGKPNRASKEIRRNAKTIVCVSQVGRLKNTAALEKAFALLKPRHADWELRLYGQGLRDGKKTREELDRILHDEADVFCSPSLEESFGMVFVEAMALGVPCVGGERSGAVPWVIGDGGVTCDVTKPEKLAACLERVMTDYELRKRLSANGVRRVRENFDIEKVVDMYEKELERVAKEVR